MRDLPSYKPLAKMMRRGKVNKFQALPFIEDGKLYFSYLFNEADKLTPTQVEAWKKDELDSPDLWYLLYIDIGNHPNLKRLPDYFDREGPPPEIEDLYKSFWQIRLALDHPSCKKKIKDAEYTWDWHKFDSYGMD